MAKDPEQPTPAQPAAQPPVQPPAQPQDQYPLPPAWLLGLLLVFPFVLGAAMIYWYVGQFSGGLSDRQDVWGQFGDFLGGILNPVIAGLTLIVVAVTLRYTVHALKISADAVSVTRDQLRNEIAQQRQQRDRDQAAERDRRTFDLHQLWISPEMQRYRSEAMDFLRLSAKTAEADGQVFLGRYRTSDSPEERRLYDNLHGVWEFLADVHTLLETGMLNNSLTWELFYPSIEELSGLSVRVNLREGEHDKSEASGQCNIWYNKFVVPLVTKVQQHQAAMAVAEQMGLPFAFQ